VCLDPTPAPSQRRRATYTSRCAIRGRQRTRLPITSAHPRCLSRHFPQEPANYVRSLSDACIALAHMLPHLQVTLHQKSARTGATPAAPPSVCRISLNAPLGRLVPLCLTQFRSRGLARSRTPSALWQTGPACGAFRRWILGALLFAERSASNVLTLACSISGPNPCYDVDASPCIVAFETCSTGAAGGSTSTIFFCPAAIPSGAVASAPGILCYATFKQCMVRS